MRILIVAPKFVERPGQYYNFPIGLGYISSSLKQAGFEVECLNLNNHLEPAEQMVSEIVRERDIDVVMSGGLSAHYKQVKTVLDSARRVNPDIKIVIGGGLVSSEPELIMGALGADFGVLGEGEITAAELAEALKNGGGFSEIKGIIYPAEKDNLQITLPRPPIEDLSAIPFPDYEGFGAGKFMELLMPGDSLYSYLFDYPREMSVISSRSCPYNCTFCYHPLGRKYRQRPLDDFFAEVEYLKNTYDINLLVIFDELFTLKKERFEEFCQRIKQYDLNYAITLRVDTASHETLSMLKESGCFYIDYSIESASDKILKSMKKNTTVAQINEALELTQEHKIAFQGNLLYCDPAETWETFNESVEWWKNHRKYHIVFWPISPFPGTQMYHDAVERGLIKDKLKYIEDGCPPINLTRMNEAEFKRIEDTLYNLHRMYNRQFPLSMNSRRVGTDSLKGDVFRLEIMCPHCKEEIVYNNFNNTHGYEFFKLYCRRCNQRFDIAPWMLHQEEYFSIFVRANNLISEGQNQAALGELLKLGDKFPSSAEGRIAIATAAVSVGDYRTALENIEAAVWLRPKDPEMLVYWGIILFRYGNLEKAIESFQQALVQDPEFQEAKTNLAMLRSIQQANRELEHIT